MEKILMGGIVGFTLFTLISYILIVLNIPWLIIPITLIGAVAVAKALIKNVKNIKFKPNLKTLIILVVFGFGIAGQLAVISPSGVLKNGDLVFWSAHGHDGPWHIALMNEIKNGYPFQNPSFAGEKLVNYHFFSDIAPAIISKYLPINEFELYFRILPFIYSLFLGSAAYFLTKKLTNNFDSSIWAVIFTYFAGSFGYVIGKGESVFWASQPQSSSGNPPQIISNFMVLAFLYFLFKYLESKKGKSLFASILILGTLTEFKIYAAIVLLAATFLSGVWIVAIPGAILAAILYFPNSSGSTSFLIFQPWWYIRTMVVDPSRLNWIDLELRRQFYLARGGIRSFLRIFEYESIAFLIFFFGNLGMRFVGLWDFLRSKPIIKWIIVISLVLPLLFLQKGVATNTSQFLQYFVLLFGIIAGITTAKITAKFKFLIPMFIILMIPTQIGLLKDFYSRPAFAKIRSSEIQALNFIKQNTIKCDIILTPPYNQYLDLKDQTPNIWDWFDTSYVSALSERRTFFDDYEQADIMGYGYRSRLEIKKTFFESEKLSDAKEALSETKANLIYFPKILAPKINLNSLNLTRLYENQEVEVWKTN